MRHLIWLALLPATAQAVTLDLQASTTPHPGITLSDYRSASPAADVWVASVDLCENGIAIEASKADTSLSTTASWATGQGLQLGVNGDFFRTGPVRVYGDAVGNGISWPLNQTGLDDAYNSEWYHNDYGWLAFGHDRVYFTHTKWTKNNVDTNTGWAPNTVAPSVPLGTLSLVSGFSQLVVDGIPHTCTNPADGCFPDRSDMDDRHPRTAMGLSQDGQTLFLVVVDGRTTQSAGMRGAELAELMGQLGAHQAINLDGGGSTQMWVQGQGTVNNPSDGSARSVANHWGVRATGSGRPAHCPTAPPCAIIPPEGGTLDEEGACFRAFGPSQWWREESAGEGGHLFWTNAWNTDTPSNWAWYQLHFEEAGSYELEFYADPSFSVFPQTNTLVVAGGQENWLTVDQGAANGWTALGTFDFVAGGDQFLAIYDDGSNVGSGQHIVADDIRLTRLDAPNPPDAGTPAPDSGLEMPGVDGGNEPSPDAGNVLDSGSIVVDAGPTSGVADGGSQSGGDGSLKDDAHDADDLSDDGDEQDSAMGASGGCAQSVQSWPGNVPAWLTALLGVFSLRRRRIGRA
jgi:hypothetical protein